MTITELLEGILYTSAVSPKAKLTIDGEEIQETSYDFGTEGYCTHIDLRREKSFGIKTITVAELINRIHKYCSSRGSETEIKLDLPRLIKLYRGILRYDNN